MSGGVKDFFFNKMYVAIAISEIVNMVARNAIIVCKLYYNLVIAVILMFFCFIATTRAERSTDTE